MKSFQDSGIPALRSCLTKANSWRNSWMFAVLLGLSEATLGEELSGSDILKKSEAAYAAVKTYVGTTIVQGKSEIGGTKVEQTSSAKVTFMRPGKVRIEGQTASQGTSFKGGHPFTIVSDGKKTWSAWPLQHNGAFVEVSSVSGAGKGSVAQGAAELMASALMKSDGAWTGGSDPFIVPRLEGSKVEGHEAIDAADCFKLISKHAELGDVTLWIDSKTFLLRQILIELDEQQLAAQAKKMEATFKRLGKEPPQRPVPIKSMVRTFSFKDEKIDGSVNETNFVDPRKN